MTRTWLRAATLPAGFALVTATCAAPTAAPAGSPASSAAASATPKKGGTLVAVIGRDPATGNVDITSDTNGFFAFTPVYRSLVEIGPNGLVTPDLSPYSNPEIDQAFAQGAGTTDPKARQAAYKKVQETLARDLQRLWRK